MGRNSFEQVISAINSRNRNHQGWRNLRYYIFELPQARGSFQQRYENMQALVANSASRYLNVVEQRPIRSQNELTKLLQQVTDDGGEGLMLHKKDAEYKTGRSAVLLKVKLYKDAEAKVLAHLPGKGKYQGMLGSLWVENQDKKRLRIGSGFSDIERQHPPPIGSVIRYKYYGLSQKGIPKFASFIRIMPVDREY